MMYLIKPDYTPEQDRITREILQKVKAPYRENLRKVGYREHGPRNCQSRVLLKMTAMLAALRSL